MKSIGDLLERFKGILDGESSKKEVIIEIINKETGISIKGSEIEVKNGILYLKTKTIYRSSILIKKDKVLQKLIKELGEKYIRDIA